MRRSQRGFTLVEVLVAATLLAALMTVVAVAVGGLARADRQTRVHIDQDRNVQQFVMQLRRDVHVANGWTISPTQDAVLENPDDAATTIPSSALPTLALAFSDGSEARYLPTLDGMQRVVRRDDAVQHRETFTWGNAAEASWSSDTTGQRPQVILTLRSAVESDRASETLVVRTTLLHAQANPAE